MMRCENNCTDEATVVVCDPMGNTYARACQPCADESAEVVGWEIVPDLAPEDI
jgi:hypothetical protein